MSDYVLPEINPLADADERLILQGVRRYIETTPDDSWCVDVYRSQDQTQHCILSHVQTLGRDDREGMRFMERFESIWGNSYSIGLRANDGLDPAEYPQGTPRERCMAYIDNLLNGTEDSVVTGMEREYRRGGNANV